MTEEDHPAAEGVAVTNDPRNGASLYEVESLILALLRGPVVLTEGNPPIARKTVTGCANTMAMALAYCVTRYVSGDASKVDAFDWNAMMQPIITAVRADMAEAEALQEKKH